LVKYFTATSEAPHIPEERNMAATAWQPREHIVAPGIARPYKPRLQPFLPSRRAPFLTQGLAFRPPKILVQRLPPRSGTACCHVNRQRHINAAPSPSLTPALLRVRPPRPLTCYKLTGNSIPPTRQNQLTALHAFSRNCFVSALCVTSMGNGRIF
jgi:hypothetical protein